MSEVLARGTPTREELAEAIHNGRWPADRKMAITPFADEDRNGREYCFRIADSVLELLARRSSVVNVESSAFTPPFSIYHDCTEIGDANGHVCSAENQIIANELVAVLNAAYPSTPAASNIERKP